MNHPHMAYKDFGYLSPSLAAFSPPTTVQYSDACSLAEEQFSIAVNFLREFADSRPQDQAANLGYCCWLRALECFKASITLAKLGLDSAQHAPFRSGLEWLFWACASWKDSSVFEKFHLKDDYEEAKHAALLLNDSDIKKGTEETKILQAVVARNSPDPNYSVFDAAKTAQLMTEYQLYYRMSSRGGAHATLFGCLQLMKKTPEGTPYIAHGPDHEYAWLMIHTVAEMVQIGNQRFRGHAETKKP